MSSQLGGQRSKLMKSMSEFKRDSQSLRKLLREQLNHVSHCDHTTNTATAAPLDTNLALHAQVCTYIISIIQLVINTITGSVHKFHELLTVVPNIYIIMVLFLASFLCLSVLFTYISMCMFVHMQHRVFMMS